MEYRQYLKSAGEHFDRIPWAPFWEVVLTHVRPDGHVPGDSGRTYFVNRHVRPEVSFDWRCRITRDSPGIDEDPRGCHVSVASLPPAFNGTGEDDLFAANWTAEELRGGRLYRPDDERTAHQRDWDILAEAVQQAYAAAGVSESSPVLDRIQALVVLHNQRRGKVFPSRHAVDTLLFSSYCTGVSNLLASLCMVAGIPARCVNDACHSMVEIWDGTAWRFVDNLGVALEETITGDPGRKADSLYRQNYQQMLCGQGTTFDGRPLSAAQLERYTSERPCFEPFLNAATRDWRFDHGRIGMAPTHSPRNGGVGLFAQPAPDNIRAVYPEWSEPWFVTPAGRDCELTLNPRQGWLETIVRLDRGLGMCKSFYTGDLDDARNPVRSARADLHVSEWMDTEFAPGRGGWNLLLNGHPVPLDAGMYTQRNGLLSFVLPVRLLHEHAMNRLELYSDKAYPGRIRYCMPDMLAVRAFPDVLGTELPWYGGDAARYQAANEPEEGLTSVYDTHSGWLLRPDGI